MKEKAVDLKSLLQEF